MRTNEVNIVKNSRYFSVLYARFHMQMLVGDIRGENLSVDGHSIPRLVLYMRSVKFMTIKFCRKEIAVLKASRLKKGCFTCFIYPSATFCGADLATVGKQPNFPLLWSQLYYRKCLKKNKWKVLRWIVYRSSVPPNLRHFWTDSTSRLMHLSHFGTIFNIPSRGANQFLAFQNMHEE